MSNVPVSPLRPAGPVLLGLLLLIVASDAIDAASREPLSTRTVPVADGELAAAVVRARDGARRRLGRRACAGVVSRFSDGAGRPLDDVLSVRGLSAAEALSRVVFRDGDAAPTCRRGPIAAFTSPGSDVVFVCGRRFAGMNSQRAELVIVHELLHTLGLRERPPLPGDIDRAVAERCS